MVYITFSNRFNRSVLRLAKDAVKIIVKGLWRYCLLPGLAALTAVPFLRHTESSVIKSAFRLLVRQSSFKGKRGTLVVSNDNNLFVITKVESSTF